MRDTSDEDHGANALPVAEVFLTPPPWDVRSNPSPTWGNPSAAIGEAQKVEASYTDQTPEPRSEAVASLPPLLLLQRQSWWGRVRASNEIHLSNEVACEKQAKFPSRVAVSKAEDGKDGHDSINCAQPSSSNKDEEKVKGASVFDRNSPEVNVVDFAE